MRIIVDCITGEIIVVDTEDEESFPMQESLTEQTDA